uniref:LIM domain only 4b n=1 Tax=Cynoglossus semilaevis TaxID=244447 RepID=A0A3P8VI26_CYNSE
LLFNKITEILNTINNKIGTGPLSWKRCAGCGAKIVDRFLLYTMDSYWHSRCLKCSCCQAQLGEIGTSCFTKSGMILCRNDYIRLFGNSGACSACGQSIPASELVMRAQGNVYHLKCFTCSTCRNRLVPGDRFHYINGSLFCEHDRPTALINGHLGSLPTNPLLSDQKVLRALLKEHFKEMSCLLGLKSIIFNTSLLGVCILKERIPSSPHGTRIICLIPFFFSRLPLVRCVKELFQELDLCLHCKLRTHLLPRLPWISKPQLLKSWILFMPINFYLFIKARSLVLTLSPFLTQKRLCVLHVHVRQKKRTLRTPYNLEIIKKQQNKKMETSWNELCPKRIKSYAKKVTWLY